MDNKHWTTVYARRAGEATRKMGNAQLALKCRALGTDEAIEAARRLEAIAMERGECTCVKVASGTTVFERREAPSLRVGASVEPVSGERLEVVGLEPGEWCAVDRFREIVILSRDADAPKNIGGAA